MMKNCKKLKIALGIVAASLSALAIAKKSSSTFKDQPEQMNPMEGKLVEFVPDNDAPENADGEKGYLKPVGNSTQVSNGYNRLVKRSLDIILSLSGLILLSPVLAGISLVIFVDDPGPVLFSQKRIGMNKQYFKLHKFRSMKMSTPHDVPTHMLSNPDQYITRAGHFLRAHSMDELPQIWDIFIGNMSIIGPRPGLWNQDILTAERDKYGANDIKPGLTGWAQINGRDELEIPVKAKLDGQYAEILKSGGIKAFLFDCRCFVGTLFSVARGDGVVEGGTGTMHQTDDMSN